jgi:hypothetical protein
MCPIRSYQVAGEQSIPHGHAWSILDAALATSAAPGYFDRYYVSMNGHQFGFEDAGAYGLNNPTEVAFEERRKLVGDGDDTKTLLISFGTGSSGPSIDPSPGFFGLFRNKMTIFRASLRRMTNITDVDARMQKEANRSNMCVQVKHWQLSVRV